MKRFLLFLAAISLLTQTVHAQSAGTPPSVPTGISASLLSTQQVYVSWNPSTSSSTIDGYYLYRNGAFIASIPGYTYYTDTPGGGVFAYTVAAYDINGNTSAQSAASVPVNVIPDTTPPTAPTGLTATPLATTVTLNWNVSTDNVGVVGYYISRNGVRIQTTSAITGTSYEDTGLTPGATYTYAVTAYDASRNISDAAVVQATTIYDITPPTVPTNLIATVSSSNQINLSWNPSTANAPLSGYNIYRNGTELTTLDTTSTSYSDTGLSPSTLYTYSVSAYDELGNTSAQSFPPVSATTFAPDTTPPTIPAGLTATAIDSSDVVLNWNPSTDNVGVVGYYISRNGTQIGNIATTSYEDSGLTTSTYYIYTVTAYDAAGNISGPASQSVTTLSYTPTMPVVASTTPPPTTSTVPVVTSPPPTTPPPTATPPSVTFTFNLYYGLRNSYVTSLQTFLIAQGDLGPNYATGFYGSLTQAAVKQFQCAESIVCSGSPGTTGWGSVGPRTRKALNSF